MLAFPVADVDDGLAVPVVTPNVGVLLCPLAVVEDPGVDELPLTPFNIGVIVTDMVDIDEALVDGTAVTDVADAAPVS